MEAALLVTVGALFGVTAVIATALLAGLIRKVEARRNRSSTTTPTEGE